MRNGYKVMRVGVNSNPHALAYLDDKLKNIVECMLPTTTGFEFETDLVDGFIDKLKELELGRDTHQSDDELRFTIPKGIIGMQKLYDVLDYMKANVPINEVNGIHIHVYIPNKYKRLVNRILSDNTSNHVILKWLDKYKYEGSYNNRDISNGSSGRYWVRLNNDNDTIEFRIFKMTFEYEKLIKIIIDLHKLMWYIYTNAEKLIPKHKNVNISGRFAAMDWHRKAAFVQGHFKTLEELQKSRRKNAAEKAAIRKKIKREIAIVVGSHVEPNNRPIKRFVNNVSTSVTT